MTCPRSAAGFVVLLCISAGQAAPALSPVGPLGYWKGDDGERPASAADASGNGYAGTYAAGSGGSTTVPTTKFANPLSFSLDGKSGVISIPDAPALRLSRDLTVSLWARRTADVNDWVRLVGKGNPGQRNFGVWLFPGGDGRIKFQIYNASGGSILELDSPPETATKLDTWFHVTCAISGDAAALYLNGARAATGWRNGEPGVSGDPLTFGHAGYHGFFAGQLDEVRIYDRALSMSEIVYVAQGNGPPAPPAGLAASAAEAKDVKLKWTASSTTPPAGTATHYLVKRSATSGGGYAPLVSARAATIFDDATAEAGKTYYYVVTAVDAGGESGPSNELKVEIRTR